MTFKKQKLKLQILKALKEEKCIDCKFVCFIHDTFRNQDFRVCTKGLDEFGCIDWRERGLASTGVIRSGDENDLVLNISDSLILSYTKDNPLSFFLRFPGKDKISGNFRTISYNLRVHP